MEEAIGPGGKAATCGHGGVTGRVLADGDIAVAANVHRVDDPAPSAATARQKHSAPQG